MKRNLRKTLTISHMFIAIVCVILISIISNLFLQNQFKNYIIKVREDKSKEVVNSINQQYSIENKWNHDRVESIGVNALESGMIINVKDSNGKMVWDANKYNNGKCEAIIRHMSENMIKHYYNWKGKYIEKSYDLIYNSKKIGVVTIGYHGPFYYSDNEILFLKTLNEIFAVVGLISIFVALLLGIVIARRLSNPISRVIETAENISNGNYNERSDEKSNIVEINKLILTINNLASTIEKHEIMQKRLTADVSHELRTPITTLQTHMEAMLDGVWEPTIDRIQSCHEEIIRMKRLVMDLQKLSKYESESLVLNKSKFDISELVSNILMNFESLYISKDISITKKCEKQFIFADKDKISQVIINLISNSFKYTNEGGNLEISVSAHNDFIELNVLDNGIGISKEDLPYVFKRFYRADKSRNRLTGGAGIGLTITKAIIDAHKGKIYVQSKIGQGTKIKVLLPKNFS